MIGFLHLITDFREIQGSSMTVMASIKVRQKARKLRMRREGVTVDMKPKFAAGFQMK